MPAVTLIIDDENLKKLRTLQSKTISQSMSNVSFSRVVNDVLKTGLKNK